MTEDTLTDAPPAKKKRRRKKAGRPKGARTTPAEIVTADDPGCIKCGSTSLRTVKKVAELDFAGTTPGGRRYTSVVRRRKQCDGCGQVQIVRSYEFDPKKWRG